MIEEIDPFERFIYKIANEPLRTYPYPHLIVPYSIEGPEYYRMMGDLPEKFGVRRDEVYGTSIAEELPDRWQRWLDFLESDRVANLFLKKFGLLLDGHSTRFRFHRDRPGYEVSPHLDVSTKAISILIYLPKGGEPDRKKWGTSICTPKCNKEFDRGHHNWSDFNVVERVPFEPSMLFAFAPGEDTYHGIKVKGGILAPDRMALKGFIFRETKDQNPILM